MEALSAVTLNCRTETLLASVGAVLCLSSLSMEVVEALSCLR